MNYKMKILYIFRGENLRDKRGPQSALDCINNWRETLFLNQLEYDIAFITYDSPILDKLVNELKPKYVDIREKISQRENMKNVMNFIKENKNYDRYVILRFDFVYKIKIINWNNWDKTGIIFTSRDVHWPKLKFIHDILFIVDKHSIDNFVIAYLAPYRDDGLAIPHYLIQNNIPFYFIIEGYYHMHIKHPLHVILNTEKMPDLNNYEQGEEILNVSDWNK